MFSVRRHVAAVAGLVILAVVAGCSSSGSGNSGASGTPSGSITPSAAGSASSPGTSGGAGQPSAAEPITVGLICSCSGANSTGLTTGRDVYDSWVKSTNASGGIDGHQINLVVKDDGSNPGNSATAAQDLISQHVDAIVDNTPYDLTWASKVQAAHIPVVGFDLASPLFDTNPDFYPQGQTNRSALDAIVATAKAAGASSLGTLYCAEAASCQDIASTLKTTAEKAGLAVKYSAQIAATAPNYTAQCVAAKEAHVSALAIFHTGPTISRVIADCAKQDYNPKYVIEERAFYPILLQGAGSKADIWIEFADSPYFLKNASTTAMNTAVDKYYPGLRSQADAWNQGGAEAWLAGMLLEAAAKAGGLAANSSPSADLLTKGLTSLKNETLNGTVPPLTFSASGTHSIDCWFTVHAVNGKATLANNGKYTCSKNH